MAHGRRVEHVRELEAGREMKITNGIDGSLN